MSVGNGKYLTQHLSLNVHVQTYCLINTHSENKFILYPNHTWINFVGLAEKCITALSWKCKTHETRKGCHYCLSAVVKLRRVYFVFVVQDFTVESRVLTELWESLTVLVFYSCIFITWLIFDSILEICCCHLVFRLISRTAVIFEMLMMNKLNIMTNSFSSLHKQKRLLHISNKFE